MEDEQDIPPEGAEADGANADGIPAIVRTIAHDVRTVRQLIETRLAYDAEKERAFDSLYEELRNVKSDHSFAQLRPVFLDLILLYDRMESIRAASVEADMMADALPSLAAEVLEILARQDVHPIRITKSQFDPAWQEAVGVEYTDVVDQERAVSRVIRTGFRYGNRVVRPEEVIVKRVQKERE